MKQFVSFMLCLLAFSAASAQVTTSSMSGHVQDEQGAPVVGALVLATHTPSGTEYSAIVDGTGNYRIMNMRSGGPYSVKISMLGFQTVLNEGINIALGDNYVLDVTLPIESTDLDEVVVTGTRSSILNSDRAGVDDRPRWNSGKLNKDVSSMMVLTNTNKGHQASLTVQLTKQFSNGLSGMIAYTYNNAKDLTANPGSVALSAWRSSASVGSLNDPGVSYSAFSMPHRVNGYISYSVDWAKNHLRSTFTLYYSGTNQGRLSYVFSNDMNGDTFGQDLIFIPRPDQTNFVDVKNKETGKVTYSAAEQQRDYEAFLNGNSYLKKRQGQYAERYGDVQPWINQFDFKFLQDIASNFGSNNRYSLQFSVDILNVGNLLNKNWGVYYTNGMQSYENFRLFTYTGQNAAGAAQYTLNASSSDNFKKNSKWVGQNSTASTWGILFGLRLSF